MVSGQEDPVSYFIMVIVFTRDRIDSVDVETVRVHLGVILRFL